ncbi:19547_t:CDS:2, partial [Cetraspora pellucida]
IDLTNRQKITNYSCHHIAIQLLKNNGLSDSDLQTFLEHQLCESLADYCKLNLEEYNYSECFLRENIDNVEQTQAFEISKAQVTLISEAQATQTIKVLIAQATEIFMAQATKIPIAYIIEVSTAQFTTQATKVPIAISNQNMVRTSKLFKLKSCNQSNLLLFFYDNTI